MTHFRSHPRIHRENILTKFHEYPIEYEAFTSGYLDFSHLMGLKNTFITEIYMRKQYKSSITKNHKNKDKYIFDGVP